MTRRIPEKVQRDVIAQGATGANARTILSNLHANHDKLHLIPTRRDINNILQKTRAVEPDGRKPIEALFDILTDGDQWFYRANFDNENRLTHL